MDVAQELLYMEAERDMTGEAWAWEGHIEPIIANTKNAVVTGTPRFDEAQGDSEGRAG